MITTTLILYFAVLSVKGGRCGFAPVLGVWAAGYGARMKVDMKSFHTEVKASKSVLKIQPF